MCFDDNTTRLDYQAIRHHLRLQVMFKDLPWHITIEKSQIGLISKKTKRCAFSNLLAFDHFIYHFATYNKPETVSSYKKSIERI